MRAARRPHTMNRVGNHNMRFFGYCMLLVWIAVSSQAVLTAAFSYRGQVFVKQTGKDDGNFVELQTRLILTGEKSSTKVTFSNLRKETIFRGIGEKVLDDMFTVVGDLKFVRVIVKERDGPAAQIVCREGWDVGEFNVPGTKVRQCKDTVAPGDTWRFNVRMIIT